MSELTPVYRFGPFCLDPAEKVLLCADKPVHLTLKAFGVLQLLVESRCHIVEKAELMQRCLPDAYVEEANLAQTVCMLRKALGDNGRTHHYVETVSRRGYRFTTDVVLGVLPSGNGVANHTQGDGGEADHLYKRGRHYWSKYTVKGLEKAIEYFRRAIRIDPNHSMSHVGLADCFYRLSNICLPPRKAIPTAKSSVLRALEIDQKSAEAHALLGLINLFYDLDWPVAEHQFQEAITWGPNTALTHKRYGWALGMIGRFDEGITEIDRALDLEPESTELHVGSGLVHYLARHYDVAIARAKLALDNEPEFFPARVLLGIALFQKNRQVEGLLELERAASLAKVPWTLGYLGYAYGMSGRRRQALATLGRLRKTARHIYVSPFAMALVQKGLGARDLALRSLLRSYKDRTEMLGFALGSPELDDLRSDVRFVTSLQRCKFGPHHPARVNILEHQRADT
jgi:DNA-binding winged helix-turn-helix (wHTH) protein/Flp pilus assembly protein TadD